MALEYTLSIDTALSPDAVLSRMFPGQQPVARTGPTLSTIETPEFMALASWLPKEGSVLGDELGLDARVSVLFRLDKFSDLQAAKARILSATLALVRQVPSDFALIFNGEVIILLRRGGALVVNESAGFWKGGLSEALDLPHERQALEPL